MTITENFSERELEELLPFYANGTLDGEEKAAVEAWLAQSEDARMELDFVRTLHAVTKSEEVSSPGELGLKRVQQQIAQEQRDAAPSLGDRVAAWWKPLAVAASVAAVIQAGVLTTVFTGDDDGYGTLSGGDSEAVLVIEFASDTTASQIQAILSEINGEIVGGPGALGLYRIGIDNIDEAQLDAIQKTLRESDGVRNVSRP